ncbi:hypothetical protein LCGC14_2707190 [marine sediment metagenome]|uniref:Tyr recombinase domain-containing protein n=1 Tax=marine sediment metagenome TaxID=412755 RepID=A0A0F9A1P1_9ZZZZ
MIGCRPLIDSEIQDLLRALGSNPYAARDQCLVVLGITTGFRISELLSLKIRDLSIGGVLNSHVRIPASRMKGKRRPRAAVLADFARPFVDAWIEDLKSSGVDGGNQPFFRGRKNGAAISRVQAYRIIVEALNRCDVFGSPGELGTHCLRKTFAAKMWVAHDQNIWKVQNALGHASPASTVAYLSFEDSEQAQAVSTAFPSA